MVRGRHKRCIKDSGIEGAGVLGQYMLVAANGSDVVVEKSRPSLEQLSPPVKWFMKMAFSDLHFAFFRS